MSDGLICCIMIFKIHMKLSISTLIMLLIREEWQQQHLQNYNLKTYQLIKKESLKKALKMYCELDTLAMVMIVES